MATMCIGTWQRCPWAPDAADAVARGIGVTRVGIPPRPANARQPETVQSNFIVRRRKGLKMTLTDDSAMAAATTTGANCTPKNGYGYWSRPLAPAAGSAVSDVTGLDVIYRARPVVSQRTFNVCTAGGKEFRDEYLQRLQRQKLGKRPANPS